MAHIEALRANPSTSVQYYELPNVGSFSAEADRKLRRLA